MNFAGRGEKGLTRLRIRLTVVIVIFLGLFGVGSPLQAETAAVKAPKIQGEGAYLIDVASGQTLYEKNPRKQLMPASTTKIMTGLLAIENGNLNDTVTVSSTMLNNKLVYGTQIYLEPGEQVSLGDLLYALLLNSANDSAVAIAEHVGGDLSSFVETMNRRAQELGADQTHFVNPSGLTEAGQVTTARDLALISRYAYQNPVFAEYVRTKSKTISRSQEDGMTRMVNANKILAMDPATDGIKPGYTAAAQNCLVASISKDGRQLIGVILKSPGPEIYTDMRSLFEYGLSQFRNVELKPAGAVLSTIAVNNESVDLILDKPIYMTQRLDGQSETLNLAVAQNFTSPLEAVNEGQVVAQVQVLEGGTVVDTLPLQASRTVAPLVLKGGFFAGHSLWFTGLLFLCVAAALFIGQKKFTGWRRQVRLTRRR